MAAENVSIKSNCCNVKTNRPDRVRVPALLFDMGNHLARNVVYGESDFVAALVAAAEGVMVLNDKFAKLENTLNEIKMALEADEESYTDPDDHEPPRKKARRMAEDSDSG